MKEKNVKILFGSLYEECESGLQSSFQGMFAMTIVAFILVTEKLWHAGIPAYIECYNLVGYFHQESFIVRFHCNK